MMGTANAEIDYEKLRLILEDRLGRKVTIEEATATGDSLLKIYEVLLE